MTSDFASIVEATGTLVSALCGVLAFAAICRIPGPGPIAAPGSGWDLADSGPWAWNRLNGGKAEAHFQASMAGREEVGGKAVFPSCPKPGSLLSQKGERKKHP